MKSTAAWLSLALVVTALGCSQDDLQPVEPAQPPVPEEGPWNLGHYVPGDEQEEGDPELGRDLLLNGGFMGCGFPFRFFDNPLLSGIIGGAFGGTGDGPTLEGRTGDNADMPYSMNVFETESGVKVVNANCLMCHAGRFNGELVLGLGTAEADFTSGLGGGGVGQGLSGGIDPSLTALLGMTEDETEQLNKMMRVTQVEDITTMRTVGQNPAEAQAISLMAHHEADLTWSDTPVVPFEFKDHSGDPFPAQPFPSDVPPWWRAKKKNALFYNAMARGDHSGSMALASSFCVDNEEEARRIDVMFKDIHAYVLTLEPPAYPFDIDDDLAKEGHVLFNANCAGCHGTYGETDEEDTFPNLLFPLEVIGTDGVIAEGGVVYAPQLVEAYNQTFYGRTTPFIVNDPAVGYMAPPLDGVWAVGPFLHNGSVPTIELVLNSKARPEFWKRDDFDSTNFDQDALGWPFEVLDYGQDDAPADEVRFIYDTTKFGQGKQGHAFGDQLSDAERSAVIEYLKTL